MNVEHARDFLHWLGHSDLIAAERNWGTHFTPPADCEDVVAWAAEWNSKGYNIYFSVNPTRNKDNKSTKDDIIEARYVHCDVDPPTDVNAVAHIAAQQEVSCVFRSGRGIGILVKLTEPTKDFEAVELINRKLIVGYGTEPGTHNIDRILKLPGTRAYMNDKKLLAGYSDADTFVEHWISDTASLEELQQMLAGVEVVQRAKVVKLTHANATEEQIVYKLQSENQWEPHEGDGSIQLAKMLRIATKLSTNEAQVRDIIENSPYALNGADTSDGKATRLEKIQRVWQGEWLKALQDTEHHRGVVRQSALDAVEARRHAQDIPQAATTSVYYRPQGLLGDMYDFFLQHAPAPNPVFALAGAKTMLAGIIGRQYQVSGSGIQLYNLVLAPSGTGKQSATSGIRAIENALRKSLPVLWDRHSGPTMLASAPGMQTLLKEKPACYAVLNEYASTLAAITNRKASETTARLKGAMLDLYTASSPGTIFGAAWYSDKEKKKDPVVAPAFSFLGDAVADDFSEIIDADAVKDGFLPRHSIYVYEGFPPPANRRRMLVPPAELVNTLGKLIVHIQELEIKDEYVQIPIYNLDAVSDLQDKYSQMKAREVGVNHPTLPLYHRVAHKVIREAALAAFSRWAAGMSSLMITEDDILTAEAFVIHQTDYMVQAMSRGGLGRGGNAREAKILEAISEWQKIDKAARKAYRVPLYLMDRNDIVPQRYIVERCKRAKLFEVDERTTPAEMVRRTLEGLVLQGTVEQLTPEETLTQFPTSLVRAPLYWYVNSY